MQSGMVRSHVTDFPGQTFIFTRKRSLQAPKYPGRLKTVFNFHFLHIYLLEVKLIFIYGDAKLRVHLEVPVHFEKFDST